MQWEFIVALLVGIPVILFPVALVWYLNLGGVYAAIQEALGRRASGEGKKAVAGEEQHADSELLRARR